MPLILAWVVFPLVLAVVALGWGALVERASGSTLNGALLVPLGLATVIVVTYLLTRFTLTAPATVPIVALGALAGLVLTRPLRRVTLWPLLAAIGLLLAYGAPVLLSGSATFLGYIRLDDTATFLGIVDHAMTHLHTFKPLTASGPGLSTYELNFTGDAGPTYPLGAFMLPAVGHAFTGIDSAWTVQPYFALCGAAVGLAVYALLEPLLASPRIRALAAFVAGQPALLYGYAAWGGEKELTAAFLLALGVALFVQIALERPASPRALLPVAIPSAGLILTLSVGAAAWLMPALIVLVAAWARRGRRDQAKVLARDLGALGAGTAVLALPIWLSVNQFFSERSSGLFTSGTHTAQETLGNLVQPLSGWQLAGIWPVGDFRLRAPTLASVLLIGLALIVAAIAIWMSVRRRQIAIVSYVAIALIGCAIFYLIGSSPWVLGKSLAISAPALPAAALAGGGMLWSLRARRRLAGVAGMLAMLVISGGVLWSNVLAYHDVLLAPRGRMAELQHIGGLVAGKGPTFMNGYEVYADRHFLRAGEPVEPAEYRQATLRLRDGVFLTKSAYADLDSFPVATLEPYRSIVNTSAPSESRPPSIYRLVWKGRHYELWQRPAQPADRILEHVPFGDSNALPYCGAAQNAAVLNLCSADPVTVPPCSRILSLASEAQAKHAELLAYQRPEPIVARGDETRWPGGWFHGSESRSLTPTAPGTLTAHIAVNSSQRYAMWLGGSFSRGFDVSVDGRHLARVKDELGNVNDYAPAGTVFLTAGVHTIDLAYPSSDLTPGSGDNGFTILGAIVLQPLKSPPSQLLSVAPPQARTLCGRPLDWIELVAPGA